MYTVTVGTGEGALDRALRKLKSKVIEDGLMEELYRLRSYETPMMRIKRKERIKHKKQALKNKRVDHR